MFPLAHMHLAQQADEHREPADALVAGGQPIEFGADITVLPRYDGDPLLGRRKHIGAIHGVLKK